MSAQLTAAKQHPKGERSERKLPRELTPLFLGGVNITLRSWLRVTARMLKGHPTIILTVWLFFRFFIGGDFVFAGGLDKYLENQRLVVRGVTFVPVTLRDGMESQRPALWPMKNPSRVFQGRTYWENEKYARKAGIDLKERMDAYAAAGYKNDVFFLLFYHFATAVGCPNDYVVQKVKMRKLYYDYSGARYKEQEQFLVEVMALNSRKETQTADEHRMVYPPGEAFKRKVVVDLETGCGTIPGVVEGERWPYAEEVFRYKIQDYSDEPGLYNEVVFDFSSRYRFAVEFDREGNYTTDLPDIP